MLFNSFDFLIFFPLTLLVYFLLPLKIRWLWLLAASAYFYMCWKAKYIILIGFSIFVTWAGSMIMDKVRSSDRYENAEKRISKITLYVVLALNLSVLFVFKYYNFFIENVNAVSGASIPFLNIALPVGISFYTFQALGYSIDVYRGTIKAEKNPLRYALFVMFFPQLVAGPIERASNLLPQIQKPTRFDIDNLKKGLLIAAWGMFMKVVIADRLSIFVDTVYENSASADGSVLIFATVLFALQVYCDFASYSVIALGVSKAMGFTLMRNFNFPYCSKSLAEFWDRWHISLSKWFEDYIYQPFVWSSKNKQKATYVGFLLVFIISGFWHGAKWTYVIWGLIHAFYRIFGAASRKKRRKLYKDLGIAKNEKLYNAGRMITTFVLVDFTYIFFRADSVGQAFRIIKSIFLKTNFSVLFSDTVFSYGLDRQDMVVAIIALAILWVVDVLRSKTDLADKVLNAGLPVRWLVCIALIMSILIFGVYGPLYDATPFIYFQF